jgi:ComF family protein
MNNTLQTTHLGGKQCSIWSTAYQHCLNFIMPQHCLCCCQPSCNTLPICSVCYQTLPWLDNACRLCATPLNSNAGQICGKCASTEPRWQRCFALWRHRQPVAGWINQLKHGQQLHLARFFGILIANKLQQEGLQIDTIIPVPLHRNRLHKRGFNQSIEIARHCKLATTANILKTEIVRHKNTATQQGLSKAQRAINMRGSFKKASSFHAENILIIDDVITTGATCRALCRTLPKTCNIIIAAVSRAC